MEVLAVIPARGGSKAIKRKNVVLLAGKPLITHSIEHALKCKKITRVVVSTEDEEIRRIALSAGAEVPFVRPHDLAEDHVLDHPVFLHCLEELKRSEKYEPDVVVHLRPTAPFRRLEWIEQGIELLKSEPTADSVRSVSLVEQHPYRMFRIAGDRTLDPLMKAEHPVPYVLRRQELPPIYYYNCVLDFTLPRTVYLKHSMTGDRIYPLILPPGDVIDIDTPKDLEFAEVFLRDKM